MKGKNLWRKTRRCIFIGFNYLMAILFAVSVCAIDSYSNIPIYCVIGSGAWLFIAALIHDKTTYFDKVDDDDVLQ